MVNLLSLWTPGPLEVIIIIVAIIFFITRFLVVRWALRINERTRLLIEIRDALKSISEDRK